MKIRKIKENIFWLGSIDWDRRIFDSLIPLPDGTSYNAYLVYGSEKTALIDTADPDHKDILANQLANVTQIDYVISNHTEQDHSGSLPYVLSKYPNAKLLATPRAKGLLMDHLLIQEDRISTVEDGQTLSLGDKTLEFLHMPWVHWPETMVTYLKEDKILFSCDLFGSHLATTDLFADDKARVYEASKRYYAEIMMPFRNHIARHLDRLDKYDIEMIAPSHGPIHKEPPFIVNAYKDWAKGNPKNVAALFFISMHGSTKEMVNYLVGALAEKGVSVERFDLVTADIGKIAMSLVDAATIILATPTVLGYAHPHVVYATYLANILNPKAKFVSLIGSLGWGSQVAEQIPKMVPNLKVEVLAPVMCKGLPKENDYKALESLADLIAQKHKESLGLSQ